ncbi:MAG TPA: helix-turn-helix transcriptional regulator [Candidatus Saccharimonadales bacterium]|nr:helix-turn-helix transcriptional regulator [Candidatus Saccharimonadales bacterium]
MKDAQELPFKRFGERLRTLRQKLQETPADVSGAVEIDESLLKRFEQGKERPTEDILHLLINHFSIPEDDAAALWRLAGYEFPRDDAEDDDQADDLPNNNRAGVLVMAIDPRIIYTDGMHVNAGPNGVVLSFAQMSGSQQPLVTARVGMSREQARSIIKTLQGALDRSEPRRLPPSVEDKSKEPSHSEPGQANPSEPSDTNV